MKIILYSCLLVFTVIIVNPVYPQTTTNKEKAQEKFNVYLNLISVAQYEKALEVLDECLSLDRDNIEYKYERAYIYYLLEEFDEAILLCNKVIKEKKATPKFYEMLGNIYDITDNSKKAIETYNEGLKVFPNSGRLYFEIGVVHGRKNNYSEAVKYWEKAIDVEPTFPSPYYHLARVFAFSKERIWALLYGEIFLNLEKDTRRTLEISQLMFLIYRAFKEVKGDTIKIYFSNVSLPETQKFSVHYELLTVGSIDSIKLEFSINSLTKTREKFVEMWEEAYQLKCPLAIIDWHRKLINSGYFEAYNYWLFNAGNKDEFKIWYKENEKKFKDFDSWMGTHSLKLDTANHFSRNIIIKQYENIE